MNDSIQSLVLPHFTEMIQEISAASCVACYEASARSFSFPFSTRFLGPLAHWLTPTAVRPNCVSFPGDNYRSFPSPRIIHESVRSWTMRNYAWSTGREDGGFEGSRCWQHGRILWADLNGLPEQFLPGNVSRGFALLPLFAFPDSVVFPAEGDDNQNHNLDLFSTSLRVNSFGFSVGTQRLLFFRFFALWIFRLTFSCLCIFCV